MRVITRAIIDIGTDRLLELDSFEYQGAVAEAISSTLAGQGNKSKGKQQATNESGTQFNEPFLTSAISYLQPGTKTVKTSVNADNFDNAAYLAANPDVAADPYFSKNPLEHYIRHGQAEGRQAPLVGGGTGGEQQVTIPDYNPEYIRSAFTPGQYTPVEGGDFNKIEENLYGSAQSKLRQAYNEAVAKQREELSQSGALNSPSQYLEGSTRSVLDKGLQTNLQQAARDASNTVLGLKQQEAARKTAFDVGEAQRATEYGTSEAGRETAFNAQTQQALIDAFMKRLALAIESGRYATGQSSGSTSGFGMGLNTSGSFLSGSSGGGSLLSSWGA